MKGRGLGCPKGRVRPGHFRPGCAAPGAGDVDIHVVGRAPLAPPVIRRGGVRPKPAVHGPEALDGDPGRGRQGGDPPRSRPCFRTGSWRGSASPHARRPQGSSRYGSCRVPSSSGSLGGGPYGLPLRHHRRPHHRPHCVAAWPRNESRRGRCCGSCCGTLGKPRAGGGEGLRSRGTPCSWQSLPPHRRGPRRASRPYP